MDIGWILYSPDRLPRHNPDTLIYGHHLTHKPVLVSFFRISPEIYHDLAKVGVAGSSPVSRSTLHQRKNTKKPLNRTV